MSFNGIDLCREFLYYQLEFTDVVVTSKDNQWVLWEPFLEIRLITGSPFEWVLPLFEGLCDCLEVCLELWKGSPEVFHNVYIFIQNQELLGDGLTVFFQFFLGGDCSLLKLDITGLVQF